MKIVFVAESEKDLKLIQVLEKYGIEPEVYTISDELKEKGFKLVSHDIIETLEKIISEENPQLVVLHKEKVDPFKLIVSKPEYIKIAEKFSKTNFLFLNDDAEDIRKIGVVLDFKESDNIEDFLKSAYDFSMLFKIEPEYIFSFYEEYYELALLKTHTEDEAKQILNNMREEKIELIKGKLAKALDGKPVILKVLSGDPKKRIPLYLHENNFDIAVLSHSTDGLLHYLENIEISIAIIQ